MRSWSGFVSTYSGHMIWQKTWRFAGRSFFYCLRFYCSWWFVKLILLFGWLFDCSLPLICSVLFSAVLGLALLYQLNPFPFLSAITMANSIVCFLCHHSFRNPILLPLPLILKWCIIMPKFRTTSSDAINTSRSIIANIYSNINQITFGLILGQTSGPYMLE